MDTRLAVQQLERLVKQFEHLKRGYRDYVDIPVDVQIQFTCSCKTAVDRIAGAESIYAAHLHDFEEQTDSFQSMSLVEKYGGVIVSLHDDVANGFLSRLQELAHGEIFSDFLEMAEHLLETGYKDAAAVIVGGALESHLRRLCIKNSIPLDVIVNNKSTPKKADTMNADLVKAGAYSKLDQKNVIAWLDLRNKAAHALYEEYSLQHVQLMLAGVSQFIAGHAA